MPRSCGHNHRGLAKKSKWEKGFRTDGTSTYPIEMDMSIAQCILEDFLIHLAELRLRSAPPSVGGEGASTGASAASVTRQVEFYKGSMTVYVDRSQDM